jgi:hypothetical protein
VFDLSSAGIEPQSANSSQFLRAEDECRSLVGGSVPIPPNTCEESMNDIAALLRRRAHGPLLAAVVAIAVLTMPACSSGGRRSSSAGGSTSSPSTVAYSACVRAHGVPTFPDPGSAGQVPKADAQQLGVSATQLQSAEQACAHLLPATGATAEQQQETQCTMAGNCSQAVIQQWMSGLRTLAQCLRSHGEPQWPDPVISSEGGHPAGPHFLYAQAGIDHRSAQVLADVQTCIGLTGFEGLPLP